MAVEPNPNDSALSEDAARRRASRLSPDDLIAPTCMFWLMIAGFVVLGGMMVLWVLSNVGKIGQ